MNSEFSDLSPEAQRYGRKLRVEREAQRREELKQKIKEVIIQASDDSLQLYIDEHTEKILSLIEEEER